jgi:hypothetical protein
MFAIQRIACFMLSLGIMCSLTKAEAKDAAASLVARSPAALLEMGKHLPGGLVKNIRESLSDIAGPMATVAASDQPLVIFLNWQGDLPTPIICLYNHNVEALKIFQKMPGLTSNEVEPGITEVSFSGSIFLKQSHDWLCVATAASDLRDVEDALAKIDIHPEHAITVNVNLRQVPVAARSEIAEVLAVRLLPPSIGNADDFSAEQLFQLYSARLMRSFASDGDTIRVTGDAADDGIHLAVEVDGAKLRRVSQAASSFPQIDQTLASRMVSFHTALNDEEVALLTWWAQGIPERMVASMKEADIKDRKGQEGLKGIAQGIAQLLTQVAQDGTLEGVVGLLGEEHEYPVFGFKIPSGQSLENFLRQTLATPSAQDLGITAAEFDIEQINGVRFHRISLGGVDDEALPILIGIGDKVAFVTSGKPGVDALRNWLSRSDAQSSEPTPLAIQIEDFDLSSMFGWQPSAKAANDKFSLTSQYTEHGVRYEIKVQR